MGHVERMGERRGVYRVLVGKPKRDHLDDDDDDDDDNNNNNIY